MDTNTKNGDCKKHLDEHISVKKLEKEYEVEHSTICRWTKEYLSGGAAAFEPKKRPGNRFAALHRSKNLSEEVLKKLAGKKNEEQTPQVVFHTDQGSVYSSQAFCQAHEHYNILRSMSKGGNSHR